jgi:hypothetical protein
VGGSLRARRGGALLIGGAGREQGTGRTRAERRRSIERGRWAALNAQVGAFAPAEGEGAEKRRDGEGEEREKTLRT